MALHCRADAQKECSDAVIVSASLPQRVHSCPFQLLFSPAKRGNQEGNLDLFSDKDCLCMQIGFFAFAAIGFNNFGQQEGNKEIY